MLSPIAPFRRTIGRIGYGLITSFDPSADIETFLANLKAFQNDAATVGTLRDRLAVFRWEPILSQIDRIYALATSATAEDAKLIELRDGLPRSDQDESSSLPPQAPDLTRLPGSFLGRKAPCASD